LGIGPPHRFGRFQKRRQPAFGARGPFGVRVALPEPMVAADRFAEVLEQDAHRGVSNIRWKRLPLMQQAKADSVIGRVAAQALERRWRNSSQSRSSKKIAGRAGAPRGDVANRALELHAQWSGHGGRLAPARAERQSPSHLFKV